MLKNIHKYYILTSLPCDALYALLKYTTLFVTCTVLLPCCFASFV